MAKIQLLDPAARVPERFYEGDAGYDLFAPRGCEMYAIDGWVIVPLLLRIQPPEGFWYEITNRSSNGVRGLEVQRAIIDAGYRGDLFLHARTVRGTRRVVVEAGERIAQMIPHQVHCWSWQRVERLDHSDRGEQGFGSTGRGV